MSAVLNAQHADCKTSQNTGLGQHIALAFARHGCRKFVLADVSEAGLMRTEQLLQEITQAAQVKLQVTDVSNSAAVQEMVACCVNTFGRVDFSCHNAGLGAGGTKTADMTSQYFDRLCNVNEKGVSLPHAGLTRPFSFDMESCS